MNPLHSGTTGDSLESQDPNSKRTVYASMMGMEKPVLTPEERKKRKKKIKPATTTELDPVVFATDYPTT